jgi:L-threonylcarbamoyladenylate synthase
MRTLHRDEAAGTTTSVVGACVQTLGEGGVLVYPTDTVYGLGADATNHAAVERVRAIKGKTAAQPMLVLVSDLDMLARYTNVTDLARSLASRFWPGPLTLVLDARGEVLASVCAPDGSVGVRVPDSTFCLDVVRAFDAPITSTSCNVSGMPQSRTVQGMLDQLGGATHMIDLVIDLGVLPESPPSTVVDVRHCEPHILREGAVSRTRLFGV